MDSLEKNVVGREKSVWFIDKPFYWQEPSPIVEPSPSPSPEPPGLAERSRMWRAVKNIAVLCVAFLLHSSAHGGTVGMQSSVNAAMGAGTAALAVASATAWAAGCGLALSGTLRDLASGKWALAVSFLAAAPYTVMTTLVPDVEALLPAAALQGISTAILWASQGAYMSAWESELGMSVVGRLSFTVFFLAVHLGDVCGNLFLSSVLTLENGALADHPLKNLTSNDAIVCGFDFCWPPDDNSDHNLVRPPQTRLSQVGYTFLASVVTASVLVALFLEPVKRVEDEERMRREVATIEGGGEGVSSPNTPTYVAVFRQLASPYQILLVPLTLFAGMEEAFLHTDFTQAYVACSVGIPNLGYVMACYAISSGVGAIVSSVASRHFSEARASLLVIGATLHGSLVIVMIVWTPHADNSESLFIIASLWGLCDALWKTQISVIYEEFFPNDPTTAMVLLWLWESAGYAIGCGLSVPLCTGFKLHMLLAILILGVLGYTITEIFHGGCWDRKKSPVCRQHST